MTKATALTGIGRRGFLQAVMAGVPVAAHGQTTRPDSSTLHAFDAHEPLTIERPVTGKPRAGQVVAAIQPHADDIPLFAAGTLFKLIDEGATAYLIRVTNDDMAGSRFVRRDGDGQRARPRCREPRVRRGPHLRPQLQQPHDGQHRARRAAGAVHLPVPAAEGRRPPHLRPVGAVRGESGPLRHQRLRRGGGVDGWRLEGLPGALRGRPDATRRAREVLLLAVPAARQPGRGHRAVGRAQGRREPREHGAGTRWRQGQRLRARLAAEGRHLPLLGDDDVSANRAYTREFVLHRDREIGSRHGLGYAEQFHYIGPERNRVEEYLRQHAVPRK